MTLKCLGATPNSQRLRRTYLVLGRKVAHFSQFEQVCKVYNLIFFLGLAPAYCIARTLGWEVSYLSKWDENFLKLP